VIHNFIVMTDHIRSQSVMV